MTTIIIDENKKGAKRVINYLRRIPFAIVMSEPESNITIDELIEEMAEEKELIIPPDYLLNLRMHVEEIPVPLS